MRRNVLRALAPLPAVALVPALLAGCGGGAQTPAQVVMVPAGYKSYFRVAARRCPGVLTPAGLAATAYVESRFDPDAMSDDGAEGLMQILPSVFKEYGVDANGDGKKDVFNAADSIATSAVISCVLAHDVSDISGDKVALRLAAYNAGIGAVRKYRGVPPYTETRDYVDQIKLWTTRFEPQFPLRYPNPFLTIPVENVLRSWSWGRLRHVARGYMFGGLSICAWSLAHCVCAAAFVPTSEAASPVSIDSPSIPG